MLRQINKNEILTPEEIVEIGLVYTNVNFSDLLVYKRGEERYLLEYVNGNRFRVYLKYDFSL